MDIEDCGFGRFHVLLCLIFLLLNTSINTIIYLPPFMTMRRSISCTDNKTALNFTHANLNSDSVCKHCPRDKIVFDQSTFTSTMQSQYGLVCENEHLVELFITLYSIGALCGLIFNGLIGDKYPRLSLIRYGLIMLISALIFCITSPYFLLSICGRYFVGFFDMLVFSTQITYLNEITPSSYREVVTNVIFVGETFSQVALALFGYLVRNHITLQWLIISGCLLSLLLMIGLPESPMWLIEKKKIMKAKISLRRIYILNNPNDSTHLHTFSLECVTSQMLVKDEHKQEHAIVYKNIHMKTFGLIKIFFSDIWNKYYGILRSCVILSIIFSLTTVVYYSLIFDLDKTHGSVFENMLLFAGVNVIVDVVTPVALRWLGRRKYIFIFASLSGILSIVIGFTITYKLRVAEKAITFILNSTTSLIYSGALIYTGEILPTKVRNSGTSIVYSISHISVALSPFIIPNATQYVGFFCLGSILWLASSLSVILPETEGKKLPESAKESVSLNSISNSFLPLSWRNYFSQD